MLVLLVLMYKTGHQPIVSRDRRACTHRIVCDPSSAQCALVAASTRRLISKSTPGMVRARYIVDALLLVAFLTVGITGVLINKTLFEIHTAGNAKTLHYFSAAMSILLMGVHLGLHAEYIFGKLFKKGANMIAKVATAVVLAGLVTFGGYSLTTTQLVSFLSAPLRVAVLARQCSADWRCRAGWRIDRTSKRHQQATGAFGR